VPPVDPDGTDPGRERSAPEVSIGDYLARQRRLRGVSLDELASLTKIPRRSLTRLEDGAFDQQADGFARGFVRTVAEALGLDAEEAVMRLLGEPPSGDEDLAIRRVSLRRWALGSALLLGGAAAIFGLWSFWSGDASVPEDGASPEIIYRRDVVRELAESERAFGAREESLDSDRAGRSDRGADPPRGRFR
jgi:transcriptional regulator with XRE-family HTH domain